MRQTIRLFALLALLPLALPRVAVAQGIAVAGSEGFGGTRADAEYRAYISASVDTLVRAWEAAARAHDLKELAGLYTRDAVLTLSSGAIVQGRGSVYDTYERLLPRLGSPRINVKRIVASADVAYAVAELDYNVPLPSGGSYPRVVPMGLTMRADSHGRLVIAVQTGGDVESIATVDPLAAQMVPGTHDTLSLRITDASGAGVRGVMVAFEVQRGEGTVLPATVLTNADGYAITLFLAGEKSEANVVRAVAATLIDEPVYFSATTFAGGSTAPDREGGNSTPSATPPRE